MVSPSGGVAEADFCTAHDLNQAFIDAVRETGGNNVDRFLLLSPYAASADPYIIKQMFYKPFVDSAGSGEAIPDEKEIEI